MTNKCVNRSKHAGLVLAINLLILFTVAGAEGICTKLKYGPKENGYRPVLVRHCCPGYEETKDNDCLPRCDLGCPLNSHCEMPNFCSCDFGYVADKKLLYYGVDMLQSCKIEGAVIAMAVTILSFLVIVIVIVVVCIKRWRKEPQASSDNAIAMNHVEEYWEQVCNLTQ